MPVDSGQGRHSRPTDVPERLARFLWHRRGRPSDDPLPDWLEAEWLLWLKTQRLRPYLAKEAAHNPEYLVRRLESLVDWQPTTSAPAITMLVVLDGAAEYCRHQYRRARELSPYNGVHPEQTVEKKDGEFYRICYHTLSLYGAEVRGHRGEWEPEDEGGASGRIFQDACLAVATGPDAVLASVTAAAHVCRQLMIYNQEECLAWPEQLHARIAIGSSPRLAVEVLSLVWRDEIAVDVASFRQLSHELQWLLLAVGLRIGRGSGECIEMRENNASSNEKSATSIAEGNGRKLAGDDNLKLVWDATKARLRTWVASLLGR